MMDAEKYSILLDAVENGSLSATAEKQGYTPSGLSRMMSSLEEEMGFSLLIRQKEGVKPTKTLKDILPLVRKFVDAGKELKTCASNISGRSGGTLRVGTCYGTWYRKLSRAAEILKGQHDGIQVKILNFSADELWERMKNRDLDLSIMSKRGETGDITWKKLGKDRLVAVVPNAHRFAGRKNIHLRELENIDYIDIFPGVRTDSALALEKAKISPVETIGATDPASAFDMVEAGIGITLWNESQSGRLKGKVTTVAVTPATSVEIGIAMQPGASPAASDFLKILEEVEESEQVLERLRQERQRAADSETADRTEKPESVAAASADRAEKPESVAAASADRTEKPD